VDSSGDENEEEDDFGDARSITGVIVSCAAPSWDAVLVEELAQERSGKGFRNGILSA
jgi:hypothetical protein